MKKNLGKPYKTKKPSWKNQYGTIDYSTKFGGRNSFRNQQIEVSPS